MYGRGYCKVILKNHLQRGKTYRLTMRESITPLQLWLLLVACYFPTDFAANKLITIRFKSSAKCMRSVWPDNIHAYQSKLYRVRSFRHVMMRYLDHQQFKKKNLAFFYAVVLDYTKSDVVVFLSSTLDFMLNNLTCMHFSRYHQDILHLNFTNPTAIWVSWRIFVHRPAFDKEIFYHKHHSSSVPS